MPTVHVLEQNGRKTGQTLDVANGKFTHQNRWPQERRSLMLSHEPRLCSAAV